MFSLQTPTVLVMRKNYPGNEVVQIPEMEFRLNQFIILGCGYNWSTQPIISCTKGAGNLLLTSATELSGIAFQKVDKFAKLLNLKFISKTMFYEYRGDFVFPEINHAWGKEQKRQIEEITASGRNLQLAVDGQCDTPGHNATYSTVSAMDSETNKLLNFRIVHVKVRP